MGAAIELSNRKRLLIFINVNISTFSGTMLGTALTTALPQIMKDFDVSVSTAQWLTSGFHLTMSIIMPMTSYLINRYKTKRLYLFAISIFLTGLTIATFSVNFPMVLLGRIVQAGGSALISSLAQVVILTIFPPEQRGYAMGWYGLSLNAAPIIAPTISGLLVDSVGWRMIFVLAIVIMVICLIYTIFILDDVLPNRPVHLDFFSLVLSAFTFGGIILAIGNFGSYKFVSCQVLMALVIGLISGFVFSWRQLKMKSPFLDIRVFKHKDFTMGVLTTFIVQMILNGSAVILPYYFQNVKDKSATISGLAILPGSLALSLISPFAGKLYDKMGIQLLFIFAGLVSFGSNLGLYFVKMSTNIWVVAIVNIARCLALGVITMPAITWSMSRIPENKTADGSATQNTFRIVSMSIGTALFVSIMTTVAEHKSKPKKEADLYGVNIVFLCMAILSAIFLIFSLFAKENSSKKGGRTNRIENDIELKDKINNGNEKYNEKDITDINKEEDADTPEEIEIVLGEDEENDTDDDEKSQNFKK